MKKKVLLSSLATIALCLSLIAGATFALFTSKSTSNIEVTAGEVKIEAAIDSTLKTWSLGETENDARTDKTFTNGGTVELVDGKLIINSMTPGDTVQFKINVANDSNVAIKYRVVATSTNGGTDVDLSDALVTVAVIDGVDYEMSKDAGTKTFTTPYIDVGTTNGEGDDIGTITVEITFPNGNPENVLDDAGEVIEYGDNHYKSKKANIVFVVEAVQANGVENNELILP